MNELDVVVECGKMAIVGVAKNCGKTTTLNRLLQHRKARGLSPPALLSTGIDGEAEDLLIGTQKPPIAVCRGQWLVSAEQAIQRSSAHVEYVRDLGFTTPMGRVLVCRVLDEGHAILAGLRHRGEIVTAVKALKSLGSDSIWVDGAYGRVVGAHPDVSDAVVVATGAQVGGDVASVVERTRGLISRLVLEAVDATTQREAIACAIEKGRVVLLDQERGVQPLPVESAVVGLHRIDEYWTQSVEAIAIPGLVSDRVAEQLLAIADDRRRTLLVADGTAFHTEDRLWRRLQKRWTIRALRCVDLAAISYNPSALDGGGLEPQSLALGLRAMAPGVPVFDPLQ